MDRIRDFFRTGFGEFGDKIDPSYRSDVLARKTSSVYASLDWLIDMNAIDDADVRTYDRVKVCRNTLAHELLSALASEGLPPDFEERFIEMVALLRKIEVWWIINVEIPSDPDLEGGDIDEEEIVPGLLMGIQILLDIALGDEERSRIYHNEFRVRG